VDTPLYFEQEDIRRFGGTVAAVTADAFTVRLDARTVPPPVGTKLTAQLRRREGRYRFTTSVLDVTDRVLHLSHAEGLEPTDQRLFFRKHVNASAQARKAGSAERPIRTTVEDISAGGCTVANPEQRFRQGDHVELTLQSRPPIRLVGQVLRESDDRRKLHLSFKTLRQPVRDRLISYIQSA
jgi:c-di-GMP-binding flagellar brake protein YcgR